MRTGSERIVAAASAVADVDGVSMDPQALVADLLDLAAEYGDGFEGAVERVCKAMSDIVGERVTAAPLKYDLAEWSSYHFQSEVAQGHVADLRIAFRREKDGIVVASLGNRHRPSNFYDKVRSRLAGSGM